VKLLLDKGTELETKFQHSRTLLLYATKNGHKAVVKQLLNTGKVDINAKDKDSSTPLL